MKTVHPVQSVLPSEPRPPARIGMDNSAPILSDSGDDGGWRVPKWRVTEWQVGRLRDVVGA